MNLHVVPDNTFINKFYENLEELGLTTKNKIVVRSNDKKLKAIKHNLSFAPLYSTQFSTLIGDINQYQKIFIHYLTPLLYRWIATQRMQNVSWMVWGGDLYNLVQLDALCYEPITLKKFIKEEWSIKHKLYDLKVWVTQRRYQEKAYSKIKNVLTWMDQEYKFVLNHLPVRANHRFFFYENQLPYGNLDELVVPKRKSTRFNLIIGNSGSPSNNHIDAVQFLEDNRVEADLFFPVSYGDARYISFLKKNMKFSFGEIEFIDRYMPFDEYLSWLASMDGLLMNTIRPQGYGNILMMMYIGKPVFFNPKNISLPDLNGAGLKWFPLESLKSITQLGDANNKEAVMKLLSHERLLEAYHSLFS